MPTKAAAGELLFTEITVIAVLSSRFATGVPFSFATSSINACDLALFLSNRSSPELVDLVRELNKQGVQFKSLTDSIDTGTPSGRFFFHVMASLAEMERELTVERTRAGLEVARQLGRTGGRKPKMTDSKVESAKKLLASGVPPKDAAKNLGVSIPTPLPVGPRLNIPLAGTTSISKRADLHLTRFSTHNNCIRRLPKPHQMQMNLHLTAPDLHSMPVNPH
jgi:hypothetical protein